MTAEEIKAQYSMIDIIQMYGLKVNRAGFCSCPFHGKDTHPSLKVYKKDYNCFTCNKNGDIFTFVQDMENCSFRDAFLKLGGTYEQKSEWQKKKFGYELQQKKEKARKELLEKRYLRRQTLADIKTQKLFVECFPVFSDDWCEAVNQLEKDFCIIEELNREGVSLHD